MVYWHLEKISDLAQFEDFRRTKQPVEEEYLKLRTAIRDAEAEMRAAPGNAALQNRLEELKRQIQALEQEEPWLVAEVPVEMALWGTTAGLL